MAKKVKYKPSPFMAKDSHYDKDAADYAGIQFVYAEYGFGKVDGYDYKIRAIEELPEIDL